MKHIKKIITCTLCAALALTLAACGERVGENRETSGNNIDTTKAAAEFVLEYATSPIPTTTTKATEPVQLSAPPAIGISYEFKLGDAGYVRVARVTTGNYDWTVENDNGTASTTNACGLRPCDVESTQVIPLDDLTSCDYTLEIGLQEDIIQSYTLTAYPVGQIDEQHAQTCPPIEDGKLPVLKGAYYYEFIIHYTQGTAVYGFFVK